MTNLAVYNDVRIFLGFLKMKKCIYKKVMMVFWVLLIFVVAGCNEGASSSVNPLSFPTDSKISYKSITLDYTAPTAKYTQLVDVEVSDTNKNGGVYTLFYHTQNGSVNYSLCTIPNGSTTCTGAIPLTSFLVNHGNQNFYIARSGATPGLSLPTSTTILEQIINNALNVYNGNTLPFLNAWSNYQCGLEYIGQTAPQAQCGISGNKNMVDKVAYGCQLPNQLITQSVAAFYYPNKFGDGKYGISCTAEPIGDGSWVITGGHCVGIGSSGFFAPASQVYIMSGSVQLQNEYTNSEMQHVGIPVQAEYLLKVAGDQSQCNNNCQYYADFALLKLKTGYKLDHPVNLVGKDTVLNKGQDVWMAGYGMHSVGNLGVIRNGQLNYRNEFYYSQNNNGILYSVGTMPDSNGYSWKFDGDGDSGGPLFIIQNGKPYLISTLTGGTYLDNAGINCKFPGTQIENMSVQYWKDSIEGIMNGTLPADQYIVSNN